MGGGVLKSGYPSHHPFIDGIFLEINQPFFGVSPSMESSESSIDHVSWPPRGLGGLVLHREPGKVESSCQSGQLVKFEVKGMVYFT